MAEIYGDKRSSASHGGMSSKWPLLIGAAIIVLLIVLAIWRG